MPGWLFNLFTDGNLRDMKERAGNVAIVRCTYNAK